jgi:hypothetical protein
MTALTDLICRIFQEARAIGATLEVLIAAFCRRAKLLSYSEYIRWMVGAVEIEPNNV